MIQLFRNHNLYFVFWCPIYKFTLSDIKLSQNLIKFCLTTNVSYVDDIRIDRLWQLESIDLLSSNEILSSISRQIINHCKIASITIFTIIDKLRTPTNNLIDTWVPWSATIILLRPHGPSSHLLWFSRAHWSGHQSIHIVIWSSKVHIYLIVY